VCCSFSNAGGRVADALRSLTISQTLLGTREVAIIHHTVLANCDRLAVVPDDHWRFIQDCGMLTFTDATIRKQLKDTSHIDADAVAFLPFTGIVSPRFSASLMMHFGQKCAVYAFIRY
jgi:carbonic anhydrase